jgi:AcrR family transcriptional regulator
MGELGTSEAPAPASTRDRILEVATRIIVEQGVGGLRIRALAREAGIREGSVYNHFKSRDEIIRTIFRQMDTSMSPLGDLLDRSTTSPEQLTSLRELLRTAGLGYFIIESGEHLIRHFSRAPDSLRLLRAAISARFHDEDARKAYEEVFLGDMARVLRTACELAAEQGALRASIAPIALTRLIVAAYENAIIESFKENGFERFSASLRESTTLIGALLAGEPE